SHTESPASGLLQMRSPDPDDDHGPPGVPGFRTWRGVYWFVLGSFVVVVALLAWFTQAFSG
ncbi:MAG TPA: hypothetical protein VIK52_03095, partial [Opitutaceae bacterium]